ncbi:LOW QUALITY PROTEIN: uncharacterized protein LOC112574336 [Pomacea canaliculata]|uniref:LOW QUALITY PROTEIN: uncharacterized protein LOC112574336 n=1 Tax=Pomacea canaliculata TaxID=400727 RepID=UPI000D738C7C|nr:LOW QUALITY PROTEIN: uncharacterized protein LOC112574336 [Pomacea canaliculata]
MADIVGPGSWNVDMEVNLFHAMRGHKPVGVNRHFQMVFIHEKLNNASGKRITSKNVWEHLSSMYDLQALNESEILPFPNKPVDFQLNSSEFQDIFQKEYPRMHSTQGQIQVEEVKTKPEGQAKSGKSSKSDTKPIISAKLETKLTPWYHLIQSHLRVANRDLDSMILSSSVAKPDSKAGTPQSNKGEVKSAGKCALSAGVPGAAAVPEPSPKRTKRTRNNMSVSNSPVTPSDGIAYKRRR